MKGAGHVKTLYQATSKKMNRFFYSYPYIILISLIGSYGFIANQEMLVIYILAGILSIQWIFIRDLVPTLIIMMILGIVPLDRYGEVSYFIPVILYVLPFLVPSFIIHLIVYPPKFIRGRLFYTTLFVAIAITFGGALSPYYFNNFSGASLYYFFLLGFFMVILYQFQVNYTPNKKDLHLYFAKTMVGVGLMGILMVFSFYYLNWDWIQSQGPDSYFQWSNNLSNNLLISMPFAFYLSYKSKFGLPYFLFGSLQFIALVLTFSRGGMIFGSLSFVMLVSLTFFLKPKRILSDGVLILLLSFGIYLFSERYFVGMYEVYSSILSTITVSEEESRYKMFEMAIRNFKNYPLFGTGLGFSTAEHYDPQPMGMYWYHSTLSQVIGSFGILGILAYGYQSLVRLFTLIEKIHPFNFYVLMVFIGFGGYSLVNVGYFIPLPMVAFLTQMMIVVKVQNTQSSRD